MNTSTIFVAATFRLRYRRLKPAATVHGLQLYFAIALLVIPLLFDMIFGEVNAPLTHDLRDGTLPALDAVRYAHTPVAATGEGKTGDLGTVIFDQFDTVKVSECVLGHAKLPPKHTREQRLRKRVETQNVTE